MLPLKEFVQNRTINLSQNVATKSFTLLFLTTANLQAAKNQSTLVRKKVYYISAEFLIGKLLSNNLINLGLYDDVKKELVSCR